MVDACRDSSRSELCSNSPGAIPPLARNGPQAARIGEAMHDGSGHYSGDHRPVSFPSGVWAVVFW